MVVRGVALNQERIGGDEPTAPRVHRERQRVRGVERQRHGGRGELPPPVSDVAALVDPAVRDARSVVVSLAPEHVNWS